MANNDFYIDFLSDLNGDDLRRYYQFQCNLRINYMVMERALYCCDLEEFVFNEHDWVKIIFEKAKNMTLADMFIEMYTDEKNRLNQTMQEILDDQEAFFEEIRKRKEGKNAEYLPDWLKSILDASTDAKIQEKQIIAALKDNKELLYSIVKPLHDEPEQLHIILQTLREIFGLSDDVLLGYRQIKLGIHPKNKDVAYLTGIDMIELNEYFEDIKHDLYNEDLKNAAAKMIMQKYAFFSVEDEKALNALIGRGIGHYNILKNENDKSDFKDANFLYDFRNRIKNEMQALEKNPLGINPLGAYYYLLSVGIVDAPQNAWEHKPFEGDKAYPGKYQILHDIKDTDTADEFEETWTDVFAPVKETVREWRYKDGDMSETVHVSWHDNLYSTDGLIYSVLHLLSVADNASSKIETALYQPLDGTKKTRDPKYSKYDRVSDEQKLNRILPKLTDLDKDKKRIPIVAPFNLYIYNSELLSMLMNLKETYSVGFAPKFYFDLITYSSITKEIEHWKNAVKYRKEYVSVMCAYYKQDMKTAKTDTGRASLSAAALEKVEYCEYIQEEFEKFKKECDDYIQELTDWQTSYNQNNMAWYDAYIAELQHEYVDLESQLSDIQRLMQGIMSVISSLLKKKEDGTVLLEDEVNDIFNRYYDTQHLEQQAKARQNTIQEVIAVLEKEKAAKIDPKSPTIIVREPYYPDVPMTADTRKVSTMVDPKNIDPSKITYR